MNRHTKEPWRARYGNSFGHTIIKGKRIVNKHWKTIQAVVVTGILLVTLAFAVAGARSAKRASELRPIRVRELVIVVDNAGDAMALMDAMRDLLIVEE